MLFLAFWEHLWWTKLGFEWQILNIPDEKGGKGAAHSVPLFSLHWTTRFSVRLRKNPKRFNNLMKTCHWLVQLDHLFYIADWVSLVVSLCFKAISVHFNISGWAKNKRKMLGYFYKALSTRLTLFSLLLNKRAGFFLHVYQFPSIIFTECIKRWRWDEYRRTIGDFWYGGSYQRTNCGLVFF